MRKDSDGCRHSKNQVRYMDIDHSFVLYSLPGPLTLALLLAKLLPVLEFSLRAVAITAAVRPKLPLGDDPLRLQVDNLPPVEAARVIHAADLHERPGRVERLRRAAPVAPAIIGVVVLSCEDEIALSHA